MNICCEKENCSEKSLSVLKLPNWCYNVWLNSRRRKSEPPHLSAQMVWNFILFSWRTSYCFRDYEKFWISITKLFINFWSLSQLTCFLLHFARQTFSNLSCLYNEILIWSNTYLVKLTLIGWFLWAEILRIFRILPRAHFVC